MTRLTLSHIEETLAHLATIDEALRDCAGTDLKGVALRTIGVDEAEPTGVLPFQVAVVPMTTGGGIITGFAEALAAIAGHIGLDAAVVNCPDVSGIAEAFANGSEIVTMADDMRFVAINTRSGLVADNDRATGEAFAKLLDIMAGGVLGRTCGVIGCGPVGAHAARRLAAMGGDLVLYDIDEQRAIQLAEKLFKVSHLPVKWVTDAHHLLKKCSMIVDASPAGGIIPAEAIGPDMLITAPGVPIGLTAEARERIGMRCYHDNLPLGVATMLLAACYGRMSEASHQRGRKT